MHQSPPLSRSRGFTLIELLVVVSIIGIIAAFVVPAASNVIRGTDITRGSEMLRSSLSYARQSATSKNHAVEVRFLQYPDPEQPGENPTQPATWRFHAIQLMEVLPNGNEIELGNVQQLPGSIQLDSGSYSSLLDQGGAAEPGQPIQLIKQYNASYDPPLPRQLVGSGAGGGSAGLVYQYISFHFLPDGSTDLAQTVLWYVTIYTISDGLKLHNGTPITSLNYFTVQVDPTSGSLHTYRPSVANAGTHSI